MIALAVPGKITVHSALFTVSLLYGINYSIAKIAMPKYIEPFGFIVLRLLVGTTLFWIMSSLVSKEKIDKKDVWLLIRCAFFGAAANMIFFFKGLSLTNPINASVIMIMTPIIVLITAYFYKSETLNIYKILGILLGCIGAFLLITKDGISISNDTFLGDLFIMLNASSYGIYLVLVKPLMLKYKPITIIKWVFLIGSFMSLPFGILELNQVEWVSIPPMAWMSIAYVLLGTTFVVYFLNIWALQYVDSSVVGIYVYLQPIISTSVAVTFRNDPLTIETIIFSLVIMVGVYLVSKK